MNAPAEDPEDRQTPKENVQAEIQKVEDVLGMGAEALHVTEQNAPTDGAKAHKALEDDEPAQGAAALHV